MTYAVGQTIEVCLDLDLPPTRGICRIVAVFVNEHGEVIELTDVPARVSECVLQNPSQTSTSCPSSTRARPRTAPTT